MANDKNLATWIGWRTSRWPSATTVAWFCKQGEVGIMKIKRRLLGSAVGEGGGGEFLRDNEDKKTNT